MVDFDSLGMEISENFPISFIEVMMVQTNLIEHLAGKLGSSSTPDSTKLANAWWGLTCDPHVVRDTLGCPYVWEYVKEARNTSRRNNAIANGKPGGFFLRMFSGTRPKDVWWEKG